MFDYDELAYDRNDPKHPDFYESRIDIYEGEDKTDGSGTEHADRGTVGDSPPNSAGASEER